MVDTQTVWRKVLTEVRLLQADGADPKAIVHGVSLAFGQVLIENVERSGIADFLRREADRIECAGVDHGGEPINRAARRAAKKQH